MLRRADQRPQQDAVLQPVADLDPSRFLGKPFQQRLIDRCLDQHAGGGRADLALVPEDRLSENLREILRAGEEQGVFRKGVDPVELYISISGLGYFYLSNQHTLSMLFNRKLSAPDNIEHRQAHLVDMVISYLTREPQAGDWTPALAR